jgi:hypothetical protein
VSKKPHSTPRQLQVLGLTHAHDPEPTPIRPKPPYTPILSPSERKAYQIAHRLVGEFYIKPVVGGGVAEGKEGCELATPGAQRTALVDRVAGVVREEMEK